jgi:Yip1 domain
MSESNPHATSVEASQGGSGFLSNLFGLYFGPKEAFVNIVKKPSFWLPLLLSVIIQVAFTGVWLSKMDMMEFLRNQAESAGKPFQAPPPQAMGFISGTFWAIAVLVGPIFCLLSGAVYLFIFRFFFASEVTFKQCMAIITHTFLAVGLISTPLILLVFMLKGDWNLVPQEALQTNLTLLFAKDAVSKPLWALFGSLDLFSFWILFLLAVGFGVAAKRPTGSAFWGVATPWALIVAVKVIAAFF